MKRVLLSILVIGILPVSACGTPSSAPSTENASTTQEEPRIVEEWAGVGPKTTEPFTIESERWAIDWTHVPTTLKGKAIGTFQIMVYNTEKPGIPIAIAAESAEEESDTFYLDKTGTFYLMINAASTRWVVRVLEPLNEDSVD
ncbi:hypothetical protein ACFLXX_01825 [Chloroflexota bacterium]